MEDNPIMFVEIPTRLKPVMADLNESGDGIIVYDTKSLVKPGEIYNLRFINQYADSDAVKYFKVEVTDIMYSRWLFIKRKIGWCARFLK